MNSSAGLAGCVLFLAVIAGFAPAADQKDIDAAVRRGANFLAQRYKNQLPGDDGGEGIGPVALAGLALLETGAAPTDPAIKTITAAVRNAAYSETRTYQIALCLLYLDRLGDEADVPLIQVLGVRLLAGQNATGGWNYDCIMAVPPAEEQRLRTKLGQNQLVAGGKEPGGAKPAAPAAEETPKRPEVAGRLHPEVEKHRQGLIANALARQAGRDDNSNTQFGLLGVWVARKHGVPVEGALDLIEKRFLATQTPNGGWPYGGLLGMPGSPSMTCSGLLGLATAVGRREERRLKAEKKPDPPKPAPGPKPAHPNDPFFSPPPPAKPADPFFNPPERPAPKPPAIPKHPADTRDKAVDRALDNLASVLRGEGPVKGKNALRLFAGGLGDRDLYFLWSLERVGVVYGLQKIGGVDWYQVGADALLPFQGRDGSWGEAGGYGPDVDTAFALLFLSRSDLVRDLTSKVQRAPLNAELRGGRDPGRPAPAGEPTAKATPTPRPKADTVEPVKPAELPVPTPTVSQPAAPLPVEDESGKLAAALVKVPAGAWEKALHQVRDGRGGDFTKALVLAIQKLDGGRKKEAREALAERLTRMSADTLRGMVKADDPELRRAAVLACAMKDDKAHVPDLIDRLTDDEEIVVRAARAGLKSLSGGQDFGPAAGASKDERRIAADAWRAWWAKKK